MEFRASHFAELILGGRWRGASAMIADFLRSNLGKSPISHLLLRQRLRSTRPSRLRVSAPKAHSTLRLTPHPFPPWARAFEVLWGGKRGMLGSTTWHRRGVEFLASHSFA